tara:strand:- start:889 stop:1131 length:243 start_codon:yes stop_codon:yes gene_type:complete
MYIPLIKTFVEVANTGSFAAARDRLFVTQSAISLRIQRLEDSLGHQLLTRLSYRTDYNTDPTAGLKSTDTTLGVSLVMGF